MVDNGVMDADAIVIGAGHNGLVAAAYLARAGYRTIVLEARPSVGGCASTVTGLGDEFMDARFNICNCDHGVIRTNPLIDELRLAEHGLRYLDVEPAQLNVHWDGGPPWANFHDIDRTIESLAATYPGEVDGYRRYLKAALPVVDLVLAMAGQVPNPANALKTIGVARAKAVVTMLKWGRMSVQDVLRSFFTAEQVVAPAVTTGPAVWGLSPRTPGTGLGAIGYALKHRARVGRPVGGSGALPAALASVITSAGGEIRTGSSVVAIGCDGDRVRSVTLADGTVLEAPRVVSACDPHSTFVQWLTNPPASAAALVRRWRANGVRDGYESKVDAVISQLPRLTAFEHPSLAALGIDANTPTTIISPSLDDVHRAHALMASGGIAERPMLFMNTPSVLDPTMKPSTDTDVFSLEVLYTPYGFTGGWGDQREPRRWIEQFASLAQPGWIDSVGAWRAMTPSAYESEFNMPRGYATSFAGTPLTALMGKDLELTRYRTPIRGLYLTGAATYPGAGVWGASGRNVAHVVLSD